MHLQAARYGAQFVRHWITSFQLFLPSSQYGESRRERKSPAISALINSARLRRDSSRGHQSFMLTNHSDSHQEEPGILEQEFMVTLRQIVTNRNWG